ncbi:uncharacterized protein LOC123446450 [Hordeum vulgare subsp. vulgare]|uniref:uncharacterized protein LOC123446450 n=1 Tax=Hordeum vulgare subsp. vulgare TaxID=112509 RepID=UPI001D1A4BED|nr:uncharacterized protein LOC123446450 [Hordeum vulgare subsp. vulgare]
MASRSTQRVNQPSSYSSRAFPHHPTHSGIHLRDHTSRSFRSRARSHGDARPYANSQLPRGAHPRTSSLDQQELTAEPFPAAVQAIVGVNLRDQATGDRRHGVARPRPKVPHHREWIPGAWIRPSMLSIWSALPSTSGSGTASGLLLGEDDRGPTCSSVRPHMALTTKSSHAVARVGCYSKAALPRPRLFGHALTAWAS